MVTTDVSARLAWPDDADALARIQWTVWHSELASLLPDDALKLSEADLSERWTAALAAPKDARMRILVALERATVRGFAVVHPAFDPDSDQIADGEIGEFVIDPEYRRHGHGSRLLQAAIDTLAADRFQRAQWWVNSQDDVLREFVIGTGWAADGAHRELGDDAGEHHIKQIRLHTALPS